MVSAIQIQQNMLTWEEGGVKKSNLSGCMFWFWNSWNLKISNFGNYTINFSQKQFYVQTQLWKGKSVCSLRRHIQNQNINIFLRLKKANFASLNRMSQNRMPFSKMTRTSMSENGHAWIWYTTRDWNKQYDQTTWFCKWILSSFRDLIQVI